MASWAGSITGVNTTWNTPSFTTGGSCTNGTSNNAAYVAFNYTFSTTGVRNILALAESDNFVLYVFNSSFNPLNPCGNIFARLGYQTAQYSSGPQVDDYVLFNAGTMYWFVMTNTTTTGFNFAVNIFESFATGGIVASTQTQWTPIYLTNAVTCTPSSSYTSYYGKYAWVQQTTGLFDAFAGFNYNSTTSWSTTFITVFQLNVTAQLTAVCTSPVFVVVAGSYDSSRSSHVFGLNLVAGQTYTAVFSGSDLNDIANYGLFVIPSRIKVANFLGTGFTQPSGSASSCTASTTYTNNSWAAASYVAPANNYVALVTAAASFGSSFNNYSAQAEELWIYSGNNTGSSTTAPGTCNGYLANPSNTYALLTTPSQTYSYVVSYTGTGSGKSSVGIDAYMVFVLTGQAVGNVTIPVPTTSTTGSGITGGSGVATGTHSTGGLSGNFSTTTSAGSAAVCSIVFVVLAILSLLL